MSKQYRGDRINMQQVEGTIATPSQWRRNNIAGMSKYYPDNINTILQQPRKKTTIKSQ